MPKKIFLLVFLTAVLAFAKGPVYELRTYTAADGKLVLKVDRGLAGSHRIFRLEVR